MASTTDPMETVRRYIDCFNKSDVNGMAAACDVPMSILDGMAPHVWHGPTATEDWYRDVDGRRGTARERPTTSSPWASRGMSRSPATAAYVVVPATMTFRLHGQPVTQTGSALTLALRKVDAEWRIMAWAWAKGSH